MPCRDVPGTLLFASGKTPEFPQSVPVFSFAATYKPEQLRREARNCGQKVLKGFLRKTFSKVSLRPPEANYISEDGA